MNGGIPPAGGKDKRISDISDPTAPGHALMVSTTQSVSGAVVLAVDKYDETTDGKSLGTIYVQDVGATKPYSGITLYAPTFNPGNLSISSGDVLDMRGQYAEITSIGATVTFAPGTFLPQMAKPVATFRFETRVPDPVDIDVADLADFTKGRQWMGMLVRVKNITLSADAVADAKGRVNVSLTSGSSAKCTAPFPKPPSLTNALFDLASLNLKQGTKLTSIVGLVDFFCNLQLAPRSEADIQR